MTLNTLNDAILEKRLLIQEIKIFLNKNFRIDILYDINPTLPGLFSAVANLGGWIPPPLKKKETVHAGPMKFGKHWNSVKRNLCAKFEVLTLHC